MENKVLEKYFKKTIWKKGHSIPSDAELVKMEDECIRELMELSATDKQIFGYTLSYYRKYLKSRLDYFKKHPDNKDMKSLLHSAKRFDRKMGALDSNTFKSYTKKIENAPKSDKPSNVVDEKSEQKSVKVISGTQGLADYLGCSKSMAFGIISKGVLKDIGIQYMVGKCWKFNREKLDKYLTEHPDLLAKVRCSK